LQFGWGRYFLVEYRRFSTTSKEGKFRWKTLNNA